jgi:glutamyl-tRNA reductase
MNRLADRYVLISLSHEHCDLSTIAEWVRPREEVAASLPRWKAVLDVDELLYLSTCNRVCFLATGRSATSADELSDRLRSLFGDVRAAPWQFLRGSEAIEAVFKIAAGLRSAMRGEREIAVQMEMAWRRARRARTSVFLIDALMRSALAAAAEAQQADAVSPSLADLIIPDLVSHRPNGPIAVIGRSSLTLRCASMLAARGREIVVVSRTADRAQRFAACVGGVGRAQEEFLRMPPPVTAIIAAIGGTSPAIDASSLEKITATCGIAPLVFDLGVPPNCAEDVAAFLGEHYRAMEQILAKARAASPLLSTREIGVSTAAAAFHRHLSEREAGPVLGAWRQTRLANESSPLSPALAHAEIVQLKLVASRHGLGGLLEHLREVAA